MSSASTRRFYHVYDGSGSGYISDEESTSRGFIIRFGWGDYYAKWVQSGETASGIAERLDWGMGPCASRV